MSSSSTFVAAAIDFGTTYSGYGYSFKSDPTNIVLHKWDQTGLTSLKTPTTLLLKKNEDSGEYEFEAFGEDAETQFLEGDWEDKVLDKYILFRRFKMELHNNPSLNDQTKVWDVSGKVQIRAKRIITMGVKFLKGEIMKAINKENNSGKGSKGGVVNENDVLFVLTVPALWDDRAKLLMREAAVEAGINRKNLCIALESEAASIWCQTIPLDRDQTTVKKKGIKYMTCDLGGGTADITVHEATGDGSLNSVYCPGGGTWGGTQVDNNFLSLLDMVFGPKLVDKFKAEHVPEFLEMMKEFETTKRVLSYDKEVKLSIKLPAKFLEMALSLNKVKNNRELASKVANSRYQDKLKLTNDKFILSPQIGKQLFDYTVRSLSKHIKGLLEKSIMQGLSVILTVGGFAECEVVQASLREAFADKTVIFPPNAGVVVLKGAVLYGHTPGLVKSRVTQLTYGFKMTQEYDESKHGAKDAEIQTIDGKKMCTNVFSVLVPKDTTVSVGQASPEVQDKPLSASLTKLTFQLYTSQHDNPKFTSHFSCSNIGKFEVPVPRGNDVNDKIFKFQVVFGDTELLFKLQYVKSGECHEQYFNFA